MSDIRPASCVFDSDAKTLRSADFDDIYFCDVDALAESEYVFIEGNALPHRWADCSAGEFTIIETGFGSGLNFLLSCDEFLKSSAAETASLNFISFEKFPIEKNLLQQIYQCWPITEKIAGELVQKYPPLVEGMHEILLANGKIKLYLYFGDAAEGLSKQAQSQPALKADAVFLDGFAPEKNQDMWTAELFGELANCCNTNCTLATFTAAGNVKRALRDAGFIVKRRKGFGNKWHMITGRFSPEEF